MCASTPITAPSGDSKDTKVTKDTQPVTSATQTRKDFLSVLDFDPADLEHCLQLAAQVKADRSLGRLAPSANALDGHHVALLFDKPSLRTRTTFEIAIREV